MNNNKINLLPNSKHFNDNNETQKHKNAKTQKENFLMRIPNEEDDKELDAPNTLKQIDQSADANNNEVEKTEESANEDIEMKENKKIKKSFFSRFFSRK